MVSALVPRRGFALVAALWLLILIAGVAAALQGVSVGVRRAAMNNQLSAEARWAARGAISHELERLDRALSRNRAARLAGTSSVMERLLEPASYRIEGRLTHVIVSDPAARVNVNLASERQLLALLASAGIDDSRAVRIASDILRWRDTTGAYPPTSAYPGMSSSTAAKGRPFAELGEVSLISSMNPATYEQVARFLTVYGDGRVNINLAPAVVLSTLPGLDAESVRMILVSRKESSFRNAFEIASLVSADSRARLQAQFPTFVDAISFTPRDLLLEARTDGLRGSIIALVRLKGGSAWAVERTVVR